MNKDKTEKKDDPQRRGDAPMPMEDSGGKPQETDDPQGKGAGEKQNDDQEADARHLAERSRKDRWRPPMGSAAVGRCRR